MNSNHKVLVFGAGSVGAHHINAARKLNCDVFVTDINNDQLIYLEKKLYPSRYKKWDKKINILKYKDVYKIKEKFHLVVLGISPFYHQAELIKCIKRLKFKRILVEKPLFVAGQKIKKELINKHKKKIFCGFNHEVSKSILYLKKYIKKMSKIYKVNIEWKESFDYLLAAHPWVKNINQTYLSDLSFGGGVLHEFSHAVHLMNNIKYLCLKNKSVKISSNLKFKRNNRNKKYDIQSSIFFDNDDIMFSTHIDGISIPAKKKIEIHSKNETCVWERISNKNLEKITILKNDKKIISKIYNISRPQDFISQTKALISEKKKDNEIIKCNNFQNSLITNNLINKCIKSS